MNDKNYDLIKFEDGDFSLDVNVSPSEDTVWLNRQEMSLLFERDVKTISKHINNSLNEECKNSTVAKFAIVQKEGERYVEREIFYYTNAAAGMRLASSASSRQLAKSFS